MAIVDDILERFGLKYEDLKSEERETLHTWLEALRKNAVTIENVKTYIHDMRDAVEEKLAVTTNNSKEDLFLKARLRNYMLLEAFLSTPEKAKEALERTLSSLVPKEGVIKNG